MRCAEVQERTAAYVAGEVPPQTAERIRAHLETCGACRAWYDEVSETAWVWAAAEGPVPGVDMVDSVLARLAARAGRPGWPDWLPNTLSNRVFLHYGLAASITLALFQLGVFTQLGAGLTHNSFLLSIQLQNLLRVFTRF